MAGEYEILRSILSDRIIAFHPILARRLGGINEALLFQQIAFWSDKGTDPEWIYKTQAELEEETTLSRYQQEQARSKLRKLGVLEETKRGLPAKLYYRVNWTNLFALLETPSKDANFSHPWMRETSTLDREELTMQIETNLLPITETTTKRTNREVESSNIRKASPELLAKYDDVRLALLPYAQDLARELNDQAPLAATTTRLVNLYRRADLDLDRFLTRLLQARAITQERTSVIRTQSAGFGPKPKLGYFFAVLEDLITGDPARDAG